MIGIGIALIVGALYLMGYYGGAFWVVLFAIANGALGAMKATLNPSWYMAQQMEAGLEPTMPGAALYVNKAVVLTVLGVVAWYLGYLADYF